MHYILSGIWDYLWDFFIHKVDGKQGLVPSNFIEEVAIAARPGSMKFKKVKRDYKIAFSFFLRSIIYPVRSSSLSLASTITFYRCHNYYHYY